VFDVDANSICTCRRLLPAGSRCQHGRQYGVCPGNDRQHKTSHSVNVAARHQGNRTL